MKKWLFLPVLILLLVGFGTANAAKITFDLDPGSSTILGQDLIMNLFSEGWNDTSGLVGGTVFVEYDASVLAVKESSVAEPDFAAGKLYWDTRSASGAPGTARLGFSNIAFPVVTTDFTVGTILFEAIGAGTSDLIVTTENFVSGGNVVLFDGDAGSVEVLGGPVVPIPSAIFLLGGGLISLFAVRRRQRS